MNKHAYLIIAHNELAVLPLLLSALDDERNDVFIHWDAKMHEVPDVTMKRAGLYVVQDRVDVRWGDFSVVEAEYALFEVATREGHYAYYHLMSGVDMPLKSQDEIHDFFDAHAGKEFIGYSHYDGWQEEVTRKMRWHLFPQHFKKEDKWSLRAIVRSTFCRVQSLLGIHRKTDMELRKGTQWISVTDAFVRHIIERKDEVRRLFTHTFCSDEIFAQTLCWNSPFRANIFDIDDEGRGCMRAIGWRDGVLHPWTMNDNEHLKASGMMFARKFSAEHLDIALSLHKNFVGENPLISILIPIYNAAKTLPVCLESLAEMTYDNVELVMVDDCSTDNSMQIVKQYRTRLCSRFKVVLLQHDSNKGVANARNTALDAATGEYICWVDADDTLEHNALTEIVGAARLNDADIVGFDWWLCFDSNERYMAQRHFTTPTEGLKNMMCGVMRWNLWMFVVKRALYEEHHLRFVPGMDMGEDMLIMMTLFMQAERVSHIRKAYYHYRLVNDNAVSRHMTDKAIAQVTNNVARVEQMLSKSRYANELGQYVDFLKQFIKLPLLMTSDASQYEKWSTIFPESDACIMHTPMIPLRTKLVEYAASRRWHLVLKCYHILVYKVVYGLVYR